MNKKYRFETLQLHVGQETADPTTDARAVPIYATTSYVFADSATAAKRFALEEPGNIYTRLMNPTTDVLERRLAALESGAAALAVATGSAAIDYTVRALAKAGDHIVSSATVYGGTYNLFAHTLRECGIETSFVPAADTAAVEAAIRPNTRLLYVETLGNPNSDVADIDALAALAHRHGLPLVVDNTFATPYLIRPIEHGADIVVHSATKFIGGHGTVMGGVIVDSGRFDWAAQADKYPSLARPNASYHGLVFTEACGALAFIVNVRATLLRDQGASISPFNSFLLLQGLETLSLRVERHVQNALRLVDFLRSHPLVERVNHPSIAERPDHELYTRYFPQGAGSIFTFDIKGGAEQARRFCESLRLFSLLANVADVKSLVIHPASTTHSQMNEQELAACGIAPGTVRLSVGTENVLDLIDDLDEAFAKIS
ncbi:MAG TPA: O-acetylhomoserine aminocarboxypropyltransferase/cysteine synthase [Candidatus Akkermansia intestinigallinarum]|uniref:O-acetylhomoserine aminocarboxypropyltransferase/cysteine synthase n=1 Tax=Candidatus Akkermansia intestinigallinarum TaxID=2838431 RepID=A0A9D2AHJ2_9BACT|nr:O-acetylhomoserine aminocarboxypropyltransferase/cysteine synthase [Candidatus Akkermansia intestinigallinarum]